MLIGNFISALAGLVHFALMAYTLAIIARAVMSWFNPNPYNSAVRFLYAITDPVLDLVRRYIPLIGGLDISPIIIVLLLQFLDRFVVSTLYMLAH